MNNWEKFFEEKMKKIFTEKRFIIDIGGGLRVADGKGNRLEEKNKWLEPYMKNVEYKVLDKVRDYNPDIIGDIHNLPFPDQSVDAVICIAVLEHVEEPQKAVKEILRALKKDGYCFLYIPFLYYYHPMKNYYSDFWRFTYDGVRQITKDFSYVEIQNVRGAIATLANLIPLFSKKTKVFERIDKLLGKSKSFETSGYNVFCVK